MKSRYLKTKSVCTFEVGDKVTVRVPRIDRASTDVHRLPCVVVQKLGRKYHLYRLRSTCGVLNSCYRESDLESFAGALPFGVDKWEDAPTVSLREASKRENPENNMQLQEGLQVEPVHLSP